MQMLNSYKRCMVCGNVYDINEEKTHCSCGSFLYLVGAYYCQKIKKN